MLTACEGIAFVGALCRFCSNISLRALRCSRHQAVHSSTSMSARMETLLTSSLIQLPCVVPHKQDSPRYERLLAIRPKLPILSRTEPQRCLFPNYVDGSTIRLLMIPKIGLAIAISRKERVRRFGEVARQIHCVRIGRATGVIRKELGQLD